MRINKKKTLTCTIFVVLEFVNILEIILKSVVCRSLIDFILYILRGFFLTITSWFIQPCLF